MRIGGYRRRGDAPGDYDQRKVTRVVVHPDFSWGFLEDTPDNDIALMLLDAPSTRRPIALPRHTGEAGAAHRQAQRGQTGRGRARVAGMHRLPAQCAEL